VLPASARNVIGYCICAVLGAGTLFAGSELYAQSAPDTVLSTLTTGTHPWLADGGRFADVQRLVRDTRAADTTGILRWTTAQGGAARLVQPMLRYIDTDSETSRTERADVATLDSLRQRFITAPATATERGLFDLAIDIVIARHAFVHRQGRVDPTRVHPEWAMQAPDLDLGRVRDLLMSDTDPVTVFRELEPQTVAYQQLVAALATVRAQSADTAQRLPRAPARSITLGAKYADARALARVLVRLGELPSAFPEASAKTTYTKPLFDAVARWQNRKIKKGRVTGALTAPVLAALLSEYNGREARIAMAIERWRWMPRTFANTPLVVNLPEYRLHTYGRFQGDSADPLGMNVVIGRADSNATPVFSANMTQVVFSPQWHVPKSIMLNEILPAALSDTGYLNKHNYELTTRNHKPLPNTRKNIAKIGTGVMVRQRSGDDNALGKVKFLLPNAYDIYLHDTPSRSLFSRVRRDFSHGCVRLGNPMAMAKYVLASQPVWTESKITEAMNSGVETFVRVPKPIPVLIVYQTAVSDPDGAIRYFNDVYGHDRTLGEALGKAR